MEDQSKQENWGIYKNLGIIVQQTLSGTYYSSTLLTITLLTGLANMPC